MRRRGSFGSHAWDGDQDEHRWEGSDSADSDEVACDSSQDELPTLARMKKVAEDEFMNTLLPQCWSSQISAETTCLLCHWANQAGMGGLAATCAKPLGKGSSKYKEHLDRALGATATKAGQYSLPTLVYFRHDMSRSSYSLHVLPPHEILHKEMESDQTLSVRLQDAH